MTCNDGMEHALCVYIPNFDRPDWIFIMIDKTQLVNPNNYADLTHVNY